MTHLITPQKSDTFEESRDTATPLGGFDMQTSHGPVYVQDAPGFTALQVSRPGEPGKVALVCYDPDPEMCEGVGIALACQVSPSTARTIAASLLRMAEELEPMVRQ